MEENTPGLGPANGRISTAAASASAASDMSTDKNKNESNKNKNGHEFGVVLRKLQSGVSLNYRW